MKCHCGQTKDRTEYFRLWHLKNRDRRLAAQRIRSKTPEARASSAAWQKSHPEVGRLAQKRYRSKPKFKELNRIRSQKWRDAHKDRANELARLSRARHREEVRERMRKYAKEHPELFRFHSRKRRALKQAAAFNLEGMRGWMELVKSKKWATCYYCQERVPSSEVHFDHIVPLAKGGAHSIENLCVSCAQCNLSKGAKAVTAFVTVGQQLLSL